MPLTNDETKQPTEIAVPEENLDETPQEEEKKEIETFMSKMTKKDMALFTSFIREQVKIRGQKDNPQLERLFTQKYLFSPENYTMEDGDYMNMKSDIVGPNFNKMVLLLRVLYKECGSNLAQYFANQSLSTSISYRRKGRAEAEVWGQSTQVQTGNGRDPLTPSGERNLSSDTGATGNRKGKFW